MSIDCCPSQPGPLKIQIFDIEGGWSLDQYSGQKGHTMLLKTNYANSQIRKINWRFNNKTRSKKKQPKMVFNGPLFDIPGEGFVTAHVKVKLNTGKILQTSRRFMIAPVIECQYVFETPLITNDTKCVDLIGAVSCAPLALGEPFKGNADFACGGACFQDCPRYEIKMSQIESNKKIKRYGKYKIQSKNVRIFGLPEAHELCVKLYQDNRLGKKSKYPNIVAKVCVLPLQMELIATELTETKYKFSLENFSFFMLPSKSKVIWTVRREGKIVKRRENRKRDFRYNFVTHGTYTVQATIQVPKCPNPKVTLTVISSPGPLIEIITPPPPMSLPPTPPISPPLPVPIPPP